MLVPSSIHLHYLHMVNLFHLVRRHLATSKVGAMCNWYFITSVWLTIFQHKSNLAFSPKHIYLPFLPNGMALIVCLLGLLLFNIFWGSNTRLWLVDIVPKTFTFISNSNVNLCLVGRKKMVRILLRLSQLFSQWISFVVLLNGCNIFRFLAFIFVSGMCHVTPLEWNLIRGVITHFFNTHFLISWKLLKIV